MKSRVMPILCIVIVMFLVCVTAFSYIFFHSFGFSVGRCLIASTGDYMLVEDTSPTVMKTRNKNLFNNLGDGDKILVLHSGVLLTYPGETGVYAVFKLSDGDISDISQTVLNELTQMGWWEGENIRPGGNTTTEEIT